MQISRSAWRTTPISSSPTARTRTSIGAAHLGPSAAVRIGGLTMLVCSRRVQCADPAFFEALGIDVGSFSSLTVKSRGHFRAGFDEWYGDDAIIEVDAAGLTSPMLERFPWKGLRRPVWQLDADTQWTPPASENVQSPLPRR